MDFNRVRVCIVTTLAERIKDAPPLIAEKISSTPQCTLLLKDTYTDKHTFSYHYIHLV